MIDASERIILSKMDKQSATWQTIMQYLEQRLAKLRAMNDIIMPEQNTATIRGQIAEVKAMMNLDKDEPIVEPGFE